MENIKNKRLKYNFQENQYSPGTISSINHTNINNNINITNYYPSPTQNFCNKETFTFIDNNDNAHNTMNYPVKTNTHKTKIIKDISPIPKLCDKKYNQCQSPYMKKKLPTSKRQKSEDGTRIVKIYKNSPSFKFIKTNKKRSPKYNIYNDNISERKNETQQYINDNQNINKNYYLDLSSDEITNKYQSNRINNMNYYTNNINNNMICNNKNFSFKIQKKSLLNSNKSMISSESNYRVDKDSLFNCFEKPIHMSVINNEDIYKYKPYDRECLLNYNYNSIVYGKNNKYIENKIGKQLGLYIILIQSAVRGFLLRTKLAQYLYLYLRIKKAVYILQCIFLKKIRFNFYFLLKIRNFGNNKYSYLIPNNNISLEYRNINGINNKIISNVSFNINNNNSNNNNKIYSVYPDTMKEKNKNYQFKNNEISEMQKELNKKKIDFAVAEKKIKELLIENKKVQNINNIIVRDNKQLALKLKNIENNHFNKLRIQNSSLSIPNLSYINKNRTKINNLLNKIITKKEIKSKIILYKYFYKFNLKTQLVKHINETTTKNSNPQLIIENNNFIINENIITNNNIIENKNENENVDEKKYRKLKLIICRKNINSYLYKDMFEKWVLRALIYKNKEFIKEKKKKKKEKFKQRKQKKLFGNNNYGTNDKKNEDENENSGDYSDEFEGEQKFSNKSCSGTKYYNSENNKK